MSKVFPRKLSITRVSLPLSVYVFVYAPPHLSLERIFVSRCVQGFAAAGRRCCCGSGGSGFDLPSENAAALCREREAHTEANGVYPPLKCARSRARAACISGACAWAAAAAVVVFFGGAALCV